MYKFSKDFANETSSVFKSTRLKAKLTGKLLGHFLASDSGTFKGQSISLIGYSLGSQVLKSTMRRLEKLGRYDLIQNVYFLAGATNFE